MPTHDITSIVLPYHQVPPRLPETKELAKTLKQVHPQHQEPRNKQYFHQFDRTGSSTSFPTYPPKPQLLTPPKPLMSEHTSFSPQSRSPKGDTPNSSPFPCPTSVTSSTPPDTESPSNLQAANLVCHKG